MSSAHMPICVDDILLEKNPVRCNEFMYDFRGVPDSAIGLQLFGHE